MMNFSGLTEELMDDFKRKTEESIILKLRAVKALVEDEELSEILNKYDFFSLTVSENAKVIKTMMDELRSNGYDLELIRPEPVVHFDKENSKISVTSEASKIRVTKTVIEL